MQMDELVARFTAWARARDDVLGAALVGSHARGEAAPDSDVDLMIVTPSPRTYLDDYAWTSVFGRLATVTVEAWGAVTALRVLYEGGREVEFGITTPEWCRTDPVDPGTARVVRDGLRILMDPDGGLARLAESVLGPRFGQPPRGQQRRP